MKKPRFGEDPAGEEFFRDARLEVLGAAGREAATLGDCARIVKAAAAAKRQADEKWNEEKAARVEALDRLDGGMDLYHAHLADLDPKCSLTENTPPAREHDDAALAAAESGRHASQEPSRRAVGRGRRHPLPARSWAGSPASSTQRDLDRALATGKREQQRAAERREAEKRRRAHVEKREGALRATSLGGRWLDEAHQEALAGADRQLALVEREQSVETVESELEAELSRRESALNATSAGPPLLREVFGERSDRDAPLSFSARDHGLEQVEQRVRAELSARDEALQSIPFGRQAAQGRSGDAGGAAETLAEWESRVRGAEHRVGEELDRLEEELVATGALGRDGRTLALGERWEVYERAKSGLEDELEREEAAVREDPAGEEFFRDARLEVLGAAGREAATLGDCARIVKAAAAAKRQADEKWNEEKAARVEALDRLDGGMDLYHAHLADLDPKCSLTENTPPAREHDDAALAAAESDGTRLKSLRGVLSDEDAATRYREELGRVAGQFNTADLDRALATGKREQQRAAERREAGETAASACGETRGSIKSHVARRPVAGRGAPGGPRRGRPPTGVGRERAERGDGRRRARGRVIPPRVGAQRDVGRPPAAAGGVRGAQRQGCAAELLSA